MKERRIRNRRKGAPRGDTCKPVVITVSGEYLLACLYRLIDAIGHHALQAPRAKREAVIAHHVLDATEHLLRAHNALVESEEERVYLPEFLFEVQASEEADNKKPEDQELVPHDPYAQLERQEEETEQ